MPTPDTFLKIGPDNAAECLRTLGRIRPGTAAEVDLLAGGVSNMVLRVRLIGGAEAGSFGHGSGHGSGAEPGSFGHGGEAASLPSEFVVKQSRGRLRTRADWFSRLDRIFREIGLMKLLQPLLPEGMVPRVLFEDRAHYLFGMEAVPADHVVWKSDLLAGRTDPDIAARMGECLAAIHGRTAEDERLRREWGDREVFVQLRVDPYYRRAAEAQPDLAPHYERLVAEMMEIQACVVHADFSPKNILLHAAGPTLVDYETGHYGDPAFDLGFFLTHLMLKAVLHARNGARYTALAAVFRDRYAAALRQLAPPRAFAQPELERRAVAHLAGCMLARIDGKSPVEYLDDPAARDFVRRFCREVFEHPPCGLEDAFALLERRGGF